MRALLQILLAFSSLQVACSSSPLPSAPRVFPGEASDGTPEVFQLTTNLGNCTASYIRKNIALTAAHCVIAKDGSLATYGDAKIILHKKYDRLEKTKSRPYDLAAVIFSQEVAEHVLDFNAAPVQMGDPVVMLGYAGGVGARIGANNVLDSKDGMIFLKGRIWTAEGDIASLPEPGDSGGPLFINEKLAGVLSGGSATGMEGYAVYVDLQSAESRQFLAEIYKMGK